MSSPHQCFGMVAEAQAEVNGIYGCNEPAPDITEQAPAAAFLGELYIKQDVLTWSWFASIRDSFCAMPKDNAEQLLATLRLAVERSSTLGDRR